MCKKVSLHYRPKLRTDDAAFSERLKMFINRKMAISALRAPILRTRLNTEKAAFCGAVENTHRRKMTISALRAPKFRAFAILLVSILWLFSQGCRSIEPRPEETHVPDDPESPLRETKEIYDYSVYTVRKGDTLYSIGSRVGIPWQNIKDQNHMDTTELEIGQILLIPEVGKRESAKARSESPDRDSSTTEIPEGPAVGGRADRDSNWQWPLEGYLTRQYGDEMRGLPEPGIAVTASKTAEVHAVADGKVICVIQRPGSLEAGWGNVVAIRHREQMVSWYAKLDSVKIREGARVNRGTAIGTVNDSGTAGGALAFRLFKNERPVNPALYLP